MTKTKDSLKQKQEHTEDCMDANDDTSVLKGKCICPKPLNQKESKAMKTIDMLAGSLSGNVELVLAMREAIKKLDNQIANNPLAKTGLPEIRVTLAMAIDKHAGILV